MTAPYPPPVNTFVDSANGASPAIALPGSGTMPIIGMGLYLIDSADMTRTVDAAVEQGYRLFDTASMYENEGDVGQAVATCGVGRSELFLTTKLWNDEQGRQKTRDALGRSLDRLGTDYLDLYLIHWPAAELGTYVETWETLLELQQEGQVRAIGVANFEPEHIRKLIAHTGIAPAVNQIELHPDLQQTELIAFNTSVGTVTQAWSPLARGGTVLQNPLIGDIAQTHHRTPGQVILRWHLQRQTTIVPKTSSRVRMRENIDLFYFELSDTEMRSIAGLDRNHRTGPDPHTFLGRSHQ